MTTATSDLTTSQPASIVGAKIGVHWIPTPSRRRLLDHDVELTDEVEPDTQLVLVSTRGATAQHHILEPYFETGVPVVVIVHPGGEDIAASLVAKGATTVVAEGRESTALDLLRNVTSDRLVRSFQMHLDGGAGVAATPLEDPITKLPNKVVFEKRLAAMTSDGAVHRLGFIQLGPESSLSVLPRATVAGIRRRFAATASEFVAHHHGELFDVGDCRLAFLAPDLGLDDTALMARRLVDVSTSFASDTVPVTVWVGTAGPESAIDGDSLVSMANKSLDAARKRGADHLDGEELARDSSASVELDTALAIAAAVDDLDPRGNHSERVSNTAAALAESMGLDELGVARVRLAAILHDVGKLRFGAGAFDPVDEQFEAAKIDHPNVGAAYAALIAGDEVAQMIRSHHERWDGTGFPNRLVEADIPIGGRMIAIADYLDGLVSDGMGTDEIREAFAKESGAMFDPNLVDLLLTQL
jgi:putative nucleotidyltransferase with HDIG domain